MHMLKDGVKQTDHPTCQPGKGPELKQHVLVEFYINDFGPT